LKDGGKASSPKSSIRCGQAHAKRLLGIGFLGVEVPEGAAGERLENAHSSRGQCN
jgi:hypothetical protein